MNYKLTFFNLMIIVILISSNLMFLNIDLANMILSCLVLFIGLLGLVKNKIVIKPGLLFISLIVMTLIIITGQLNQISIFILIILFIFIQKSNNENSMDIYINSSLLIFIVIVSSYFLFGFNSANDTTIWRSFSSETYFRMSLGYYHSNVAMMNWLTIVMALYSKMNKKNIIKIIILIVPITLFLYSLTVTRTYTIVILAYSILFLLFRKKLEVRISKSSKKVLAIGPSFFLLFSLILVKLTDITWFNNLLSGRLAIYSNAWKNYGFSFFGNAEVESLMFDNAYLHMLMSKGFIFTIVFLITFFLIVKGSKVITIREFILIFGFLIAGIMETILLKFEFLVLILIMLYRKDQHTNKNGVLYENERKI